LDILPDSLILSAIHLITEILELTPLLNLSTRYSIDKVVLSTSMKTGINADIVIALHGAIMASVHFPAGIAVLPHAIRIFEKDCSGIVSVRESAMRCLKEVEWLIHPRLPAQKTGNKTGDENRIEDRYESGDKDLDESQDALENERESEGDDEGENERENETSEHIGTGDNDLQPNVPHNTVDGAISVPTFVSMVPVEAVANGPNFSTGTKNPAVRDVFSTGGWKNIQKEDEESDGIPEIDMEFDSDSD
jgi:hypothetical protein